jgi:phosphoglucosamine mutase
VKLFGTDGVRGVANEGLDAGLAMLLGRVGGYVIEKNGFRMNGQANRSTLFYQGQRRKPAVLVGKDTRSSGDLLEAALTAGLCSVGIDVWHAGVITSPGVAYLAKELGAAAGIVISASHNPAEYNGIKFFSASGEKISSELEEKIENEILAIMDGKPDGCPRPKGMDLGKSVNVEDRLDDYVSFLVSSTPSSLRGLKLVVDCANGATSDIAPRVLRRLGAEVTAINNAPDGCNVNLNCGSTEPGMLVDAVLKMGADAGIAHDGDGDRVIMVDETGHVLDGDYILTIVGQHMIRQGRLPGSHVVATVMSNLGLDIAFRKLGGKVIRTHVGDRCVLEEMQSRRAALGGEQSGHVILLDHLPTGDGILTALQVLGIIKETGKPLSVLASQMEKLPQIMENVKVSNKGALSANSRITRELARAEEQLGDYGRVLVRPSGTEPVIRIMVEGENEELVRSISETLKKVITEELGSEA